MSALRFIISMVLFGFFLWYTIGAYQRYLDAQENLKVAQHEADVAAAEAAQAQQEFQNVVKYNCYNPVITAGKVTCPNG